MSHYPKLRMIDPVVLSAKADMGSEDLELFRAAKTADEVVALFQKAERLGSLAKAIPFMLPLRECVWLSCLWGHLSEKRGHTVSKALKAADIWVREQSEPARYKAFEFANDENMATPGAWAGMAAFFSGPSLAPIDAEQAVPPPLDQAPAAAVTALSLALAMERNSEDAAHDYCALALDVSAGHSGVDLLAKLAGARNTASV